MQKKALRERVSCPGAGLYIWYHLEYLHKEANRGHPNQMAEAPFSEKIFFTLSELLTLSLKCNTDWPRYRAMLHLMPVAHTEGVTQTEEGVRVQWSEFCQSEE